jgi:hypothetical protein
MEILRMEDANTLLRTAWSYAAGGVEVPVLAMKPGGNGPALLWPDGTFIHLDAFGQVVENGKPPLNVPEKGGAGKKPGLRVSPVIVAA